MKKLKLLFVIFISIALTLILCNSANAANTKELKAVEERPYTPAPNIYHINIGSNGVPVYSTVYKIVESNGSYNNALYCLRAGLGFGDGTSLVPSNLNYTETYNLKTDVTGVMNYYSNTIGFNIRNDEYNAILWIIDNMYLPEKDNATMRARYLEKAGIAGSELSDNDIEVVQQMALWYFSNYDTNKQSGSLSLDVDNVLLGGLIQEYETGGSYNTRKSQINTLYRYLVNEAKAHINDYGTGNTRQYNVTAPAINVNDSSKTVTTGTSETIIGPFSLTEIPGNISYDFEIKVTDNSGNVIPEYQDTVPVIFIVSDPSHVSPDFTSLKDTVGQGNFYLMISNRYANSAGLDLTDVNINIEYNYDDLYTKYNTTATLWIADVANQQPVLLVDREEIKDFDLALRKNITKVNGRNITNSKEPNIDTSKLNTIDPTTGNKITTAEYKHRKDPVEVKPGDKVTYKISVYNEGDINGVVTEIVDYLPIGLEFDPSDNPEYIVLKDNYTTSELTGKRYVYEYDTTNRIIRILPLNSDYIFSLNSYNGTTLDSKSLDVVCKVTANYSTSDQVLTNIATMKYAPADIAYANIPDRDSDEDNFTLPRDFPSYKGNGNPSDLSQSNYYYKGQEDDDDFDKVVVKGVEFDLALRKYITKVNNVNLPVTKEPNIDTSKLNTIDTTTGNEITTSEYKHRKNEVVVERNDKVTYKISVYNEGNIDGIVKEIIDYLPEGLSFDPTDNPNLIAYKANFTASEITGQRFAYEYNATTRQIRILPIIVDGEGDNYLFKIDAYNGTTLDSESIEIVCKVTAENKVTDQVLTNIATMKYAPADGSNLPDRDSSEDEFVLPADLPNYEGRENKSDLTDSNYYYKGQQDDDDFDKVIVRGVQFDLALRKYITKVNGEDITNSKVPDIDTTYLDNLTKKTAEYKHRKDPVQVYPGDKVTYTISVYNEGEIDGIVKEIIDYLPEGLTFNPTDNPDLIAYKANFTASEITGQRYAYEYNATTRQIRILPIIIDGEGNNYLFKLDAYNGTTLDSESLEIVCRVTAQNKEDDQVLTNIATMKYAPADGSNIPDRDSSEDVFELPTDLPNYKGVDNPTDLSQSDFYYKGQEDDDDFDKVIIKGVKFDLALRKYITKVNGRDITNSKIPNIDTTDLNNPDTTAEYKHRKDPVQVYPGDKVTYTISVYNEGDIDGIVKEIIDYLPEGLSFNIDDNPELIMKKDSYTEAELEGKRYACEYSSTERKISIKPIDSEYLFRLDAYDGTTLDSESLEIVCRVTAQNKEEDQRLTNIATMKYAPADESDIPDRDSSEDNFELPTDLPNYEGEDNKPDLTDSDYYYKGQEDDDDFDKVIIKGVKFDLALRKYITKLNGDLISPTKVPNIDTTELNNPDTTAEYKHRKDPVQVHTGDKVTYTISVYNEGDIDGIVTEIIDYLPEGLSFNIDDNPELITKKNNYTEAELEGKKYACEYFTTERKISIQPIDSEYLFRLDAYDGTTLDSESIEIVCRVTAPTQDRDKILTNIATMKYKPAESKDQGLTDRDSAVDNLVLPSDWEKYKGDNENKDYLGDSSYFYEGQEDDDDFDKVVIPGVPFDLSLRKFITKVNGKNITSRIPMVDTSKLNTLDEKTGEKITTAKYTHSKEPVIVKKGDIVTFTIRVYNEGMIDGYAPKIADYIPEGLGYIMDYKTNTNNYWTTNMENDTKVIDLVGEDGIYETEKAVKNLKLSDFDNNRVSSLSNVKIVAGNVKVSSTAIEDELIKAYNKNLTISDIDTSDNWQQSVSGTDGLYYRDVEITCIVLAENTYKGQLRNIAEIQEDRPVDDNDNPIDTDDLDSTPDDVRPDEYTPPIDNSTYQEDDDDYEPIELRYFDLALRKFITAINDESITTRIPEPTINSDGELEYIHDKTPLYVANSDIVTYTIRVYNEGTVLGYATEIADDIPDGLEFLPNNSINKEYRWVMIDKDGAETEDASEAVEIRTKYLEDSLLRPFDATKEISTVDPLNPDYAEVKVAFKVIDKNITQPDRIITNQAQITDDKAVDEYDNELDLDDEDSTPDEWIDGEDDQDIEKIYVKKFDLALLKWVTKTIVIVDGKTTTTETGFKPSDDPEPIAKVVIDKKKLDKTTVKFVYNIIIMNQGEIEGYATEITDYIPEGLEFYEEDNPIWTKTEDGKITTRAIENILLKPGQSVTIEVVFRWKKGEKNLGIKTNIAEISEDYNEYGSPDVDSTPDNVEVPDYDEQQEDDDDKALVMLELKTGGLKKSYLWLGFTFVTIIAVGVAFIKKYVI